MGGPNVGAHHRSVLAFVSVVTPISRVAGALTWLTNRLGSRTRERSSPPRKRRPRRRPRKSRKGRQRSRNRSANRAEAVSNIRSVPNCKADIRSATAEISVLLVSKLSCFPARDILAITVNRWPHGYSYDGDPLHDPEWPAGQAPHEIGRQQFGRIAIASADAGGSALINVAIDQAHRAVTNSPSRSAISRLRCPAADSPRTAYVA